MSNNELNWKIGGEAGYGIMTVGEIFSKAFIKGGYYVVAHTEYPSLIRGGHNTFQVRIAAQQIRAPTQPVDVLVALNAETITLDLDDLVPGGLLLYDAANSDVAPARKDITLCDVPLAQLIADLHLPKVAINMAAMGASVGLIGFELSVLNAAIEDAFGGKGEKIVEQNVGAAKAGYEYVTRTYPEPYKGGLTPVEGPPRMTLTGNDAICMGAFKAGMKFIAIYPMTPTHTIMTYMAAHAREYGVMMIQPEDEIAGINLAVGASFAGARSMVATSGGGFSLMVEGLGLAGATETPLVVVEGQRPGPSTGLATRTAQADLRFCLHASQGDFFRVVLAPGTPQSASMKRSGRSISLTPSKRLCSFSPTSTWRRRFSRQNRSQPKDCALTAACYSPPVRCPPISSATRRHRAACRREPFPDCQAAYSTQTVMSTTSVAISRKTPRWSPRRSTNAAGNTSPPPRSLTG